MTQPLTLVVGATGQLGAVVVRKLRARGKRVRALVRADSNIRHLVATEIETVTGDLLDPLSIEKACDGVNYVIATANAALPRKRIDRFDLVDSLGYRGLIDASRRCGVQQFVFTSVAPTSRDAAIPLFRAKRETEEYLKVSGIPYTIIRAASFMDVAFAMIGSDLPLRGAEAATIERQFWFTQKFFQKVRNRVASGHAMVAGNGNIRHSFIAIDDVAEYLVRSLDSHFAINHVFEVGGPEALSALDVVRLYETLLSQKLRISKTPAFVFRILSTVLRPISPAAGNIMAMNYLAATEDGIVPGSHETAERFGIPLTTAEAFLGQKASSVRNRHSTASL